MWPFKKNPQPKPEVLVITKAVPINQVKLFKLVPPPYRESYHRSEPDPAQEAFNSEGFSNKVFRSANAAAEASNGRFAIAEISLVETDTNCFQEVHFGKGKFYL